MGTKAYTKLLTHFILFKVNFSWICLSNSSQIFPPCQNLALNCTTLYILAQCPTKFQGPASLELGQKYFKRRYLQDWLFAKTCNQSGRGQPLSWSALGSRQLECMKIVIHIC